MRKALKVGLGNPWYLLLATFVAVGATSWLARDAIATSPPPPTNYVLTVTVSPGTGGTVNPDPNPSGGNAPATPSWTETYTSGASVSLSPSPATGKRFDHWGGSLSGTSYPASISMTSNKSVTAYFTDAYQLTTSVQGQGSVSPSSGTYAPNQSVSVKATAATGWRFDHWSGDASGTSNPVSITMNGHKSVTAVFTLITYTLTTSASPQGAGTVSPAGTSTQNSGATVNVTATPSQGYIFGSWSGDATGTSNPVSVTMNASKTLTANFTSAFTLTTSASPGNGGTVSPSGTTSHASGSSVTVSATAAQGYRFTGWSGALTGTTSPATLTMDASKSVTANFVQRFTLTTTVQGSGSVDPSSGTYDAGTAVALTATGNNSRFDHWEGGLTGSANPGQMTMDGNKSVTAVFVDTCTLTVNKEGNGTVTPSGTTTCDKGATVTVSATPDADWQFKGWEGPVADTNSAQTTVTVNSNTTVKAVFTQEYKLDVTVASGQGTVTGGGWYARNTDAAVTATPASGSAFDSWEGPVADAEKATTTVHMDGNKSVSATFGTAAQMTVTLDPGVGTLRLNPGGQNHPDGVFTSSQAQDIYAVGKSVEITVILAAGYEIDHWKAPLSGNENPKTVTVDGDCSYVAFLAPIYYNLTMVADPEAGGTTDPSPGTHEERRNSIVPLEASPEPGYRFVQWYGDVDVAADGSASAFMDLNKQATAVFAPFGKYVLSASWEGPGTVTPTYQSCSAGDLVLVTATPDPGARFVVWKGKPVDGVTDPVVPVFMNSDHHLHAVFAANNGKFVLTTSVDGRGSVSPSGGSYNYGATVEIRAIPDAGWRFVRWEGDDIDDSTDNPEYLTMNSDKHVKAVFAPEGMYVLEVGVEGNGRVELSPSGGYYSPGTPVTLTAIPASEWYFDVWKEDLEGSSANPVTIVMNSDKQVTAVFTQDAGGDGGGGGGGTEGGGTNGGGDPLQPPCIPEEFPTIHSDPIEAFSGQVYLDLEDLRLKGRGMDVVWKRHYRSQTGGETAMGQNWDHSYHIRIERSSLINNGRDLVVRYGDGRAFRLEYSASAKSWRRAGLFFEVIRLLDGSYTQTMPDGATYRFRSLVGAAAGKIHSITDRNGNSISFQYNALGRLTSIIDTLGRTIAISYNGAGKISAVTDFSGRQVQYTYYGASESGGSLGDLKTVTSPAVTGTPHGNDFPAGKSTLYTYTTGAENDRLNHNLVSIRDAKGQVFVTNTYATTTDPQAVEFDRVVRQEWGGGSIDLTYVALNPSSSNHGASLKAIVNDRAGNVQEYWYDSRDRGVLFRAYTGRAPFADAPTTDTSNRPANKLRSTDPDYYDQVYAYNEDNLITSVTYFEEDQQVSRREYAFEGDIVTEPPRGAAGNLRIVRRILDTPNGPRVLDRLFTFLESHGCGGCNLNFVTHETDENGYVTYHTYDARGNRVQTSYPVSGVVENFEYNQYGQITAHVLPDNGSGHRQRNEYHYGTSGNSRGYLESVTVDAGGANLTASFTYDVRGNVVTATDALNRATSFTYNQLDQIVEVTSRTVSTGVTYRKRYYYDANNNLVRVDVEDKNGAGQPQGDGWLTSLYEYDILNNPVRLAREVSSGTYIASEYDYDANYNLSVVRTPLAVSDVEPDNLVEIRHDERDRVWQVVAGGQGFTGRSTTQLDYDAQGNMVRRAVGLEANPQIYIYRYDSANRLVEAEDPMGNTASYEYDNADQLVSERVMGELIDGSGGPNVRLQETLLDYDPMGRLVEIERLRFDPSTQASIGSGSSTTLISYTPSSRIATTTGPRGAVTSFTYDTANRLSRVEDALGNRRDYTYNGNSNVSRVTETHKLDPLVGGADQVFTVDYGYDGLDRVTQVTDGAGTVTNLVYDSRHNVVKVRRPQAFNGAGAWEEYTYDGLDRLVKTARLLYHEIPDPEEPYPAQYIETLTGWDDNSRIAWARDANGNETHYAYDALDRLVQVTYADGTYDSVQRDLRGNIYSATDAAGTTTTAIYDALNRLSARLFSAGAGIATDTTWEDYLYDGLSRTVSARNDTSTVTFAYDSLGSAIRETLDGRMVTRAFDAAGNETQTEYPGGGVLARTFDALDRLATVTRSGESQALAAYRYAGPDRVLRRDYANGTQMGVTYDGVQGTSNPTGDYGFREPVRLLHTRTSDAAVVSDLNMVWSRTGVKEQEHDLAALGTRYGLTHDTVGRLATFYRTLPGQSAAWNYYAYDGAQNRTYVGGYLGDTGAYTMSTATPEPHDRAVNQYTTTPWAALTHDAVGALTEVSRTAYPPLSQSLSYDALGRLVQSTREERGAWLLWDDFNDGDLAGWTVWSGEWDAYDFENLYHLTAGAIAYPQPRNGVEATFSYVIGNPQNPDQTAHVDLRYVNGGDQDGDSLRLTITPTEVALSQRVDGVWTSLGTASVQTQWTHYQVRIQAWGRHVRVWRNLWNQAPEQLLDVTGVTQSGSTHFVVRAEADSTHEFDNIVVREYLEATGRYGYDALGRRVARTSDGERYDDLRYVYDGWQVAEERDAAGTVRAEYVYGNGLDEVLRMARDGQAYYYHHNDQGTVHAVTDAAGAVAERYAYGAFGEPLVYDGTGQALTASVVGNPYLFAGREWDGETRFYNFRHRYLDPRQGRFLTRDPLGLWADPGNWGNPYAYCANAPWTCTDPLGLRYNGHDSLQDALALNPHRAPIPGRGVEGYVHLVQGDAFFHQVGRALTVAAVFVPPPCEARRDAHAFLDSVGMIPGVGDGADLASGLLYLTEGDYLGAGLSLAATLPYLGSAPGAVKLARHADALPGGMADELAATLHLTDSLHRHHLLPKQFKDKFKTLGLDIEDYVIMLPQGRHNRKPNGIHTGKDHWNHRWDVFLRSGNVLSPERVLEHLEVLRNEFGI